MGGNSRIAIRRAVESCQGWAPFPSAGIARASKTAEVADLDDLRPRIAYARAHAEEVGRTEPLDICWSAGAGADAGHLERLAAEGITWATIGFPAKDRRTYIDAMRRYADQLR